MHPRGVSGRRWRHRARARPLCPGWLGPCARPRRERARAHPRHPWERAIYGGSYGWSSAGRLHHAQSQMRRFLALAGGCVGSTETYSHAAAEVLYPHIVGLDLKALQDATTALPLVAEHCELLLAFGGISRRTAQVASSGTARHEVAPWMAALQRNGVEAITVAPERGDLPGDWLAIRPGTDTALMLALMYEIERAAGRMPVSWKPIPAAGRSCAATSLARRTASRNPPTGPHRSPIWRPPRSGHWRHG
ncbi:MAG: molybdopterin-dependent oxidoreductase [Rhodobacteraceae bacterium]|nr:molybdopterin-dependent oxidoreductase [Paracoccaceae bacterium]